MKQDMMDMNGDGLIIRKMEIEDLEKVLPIAATDPSNPWSRNMFLQEFSQPSSYCFLLSDRRNGHSENPLGFICFRNLEDESELLSIAIAPDYRQKGLGKRLMEFYIDFCEAKGVKKYYLEVDSQNISALRLYQSFSYKEVGKRKNFYKGKNDALIMER